MSPWALSTPAKGVQERNKVCTALGLLRKEQHHLVTSVAERLPVLPILSSETEGVQQHAHEMDEKQSIFITQQCPGKN